MSNEGNILRIEKISPNDGNGLRTVVFFKGCPLRCKWCSTPESHKINPELYYKLEKCVSCGTCINKCAERALSLDEDTHKIIIDKTKCINCFECTKQCLKGALGIYGKNMTVEEVVKVILKDEIFYFHSNGGVTLSGGDVLLQSEFAKNILIKCKESGIHTMAELDMFGDFKNIEKILPYLDSFYVDIKLIDNDLHKKWVGVENTTILENIKKAAQISKPGKLHIRVPLIWDINDSYDNIFKTAQYCNELNSCEELEFLPYHRLGQITYKYLNKKYDLENLTTMSYEDAYKKVCFLKDLNFPFKIKISGKVIND